MNRTSYVFLLAEQIVPSEKVLLLKIKIEKKLGVIK